MFATSTSLHRTRLQPYSPRSECRSSFGVLAGVFTGRIEKLCTLRPSGRVTFRWGSSPRTMRNPDTAGRLDDGADVLPAVGRPTDEGGLVRAGKRTVCRFTRALSVDYREDALGAIIVTPVRYKTKCKPSGKTKVCDSVKLLLMICFDLMTVFKCVFMYFFY